MNSKERIAVAMSGGVDSSVAAALLIERGYDVFGLTMRLLDEEECSVETPRCCSPQDIKDARMIAAQLGIPAYVIDLREEFRKRVIDYFYSTYLKGETPNPCIHCNHALKFGILLRKALEIGAERIATGHYARIEKEGEAGRFILKRATDRSKDQAYFLFSLDQEQLSKSFFPIGDMRKEEVRQKARELSLDVAEKRESQDTCFSPSGNYRTYYSDGKGDSSGQIVDMKGNVIGHHDGIHNFTVGQRRGLGIAHGKPLYVVKIDSTTNTITVGEEEELCRVSMEVKRVNWIRWSRPPREFEALVKIRSTHPGEHASIRSVLEDHCLVEFARPVKGVSNGQAAVFYEGDEVLGGGWICSS